eukprot:scaffold30528_cov61-Cyclotella_meneghiniana.AAC.3
MMCNTCNNSLTLYKITKVSFVRWVAHWHRGIRERFELKLRMKKSGNSPLPSTTTLSIYHRLLADSAVQNQLITARCY